MEKELLTILTVVFASTGFWQFVSTWWSKKTEKRSDIEEGVLALLHDKIYYLCEKHINEGSVDLDGLENLEYLIKPYTNLGGNGTCDRLYNQVKGLPIKGD